MSIPTGMIERSAFAIYSTFIAHGIGTRKVKRDSAGKAIIINGVPLLETPDEAAARRWQAMPELSRQRFYHEAAAALEAA